MEAVSNAINSLFGPLLRPLFSPANAALGAISAEWIWRACAVGLFVCTMLWVAFGLRKEYVNLDAPGKGLLYDLRLWTVISMAPHVFIYLYF
jgi:hypothetical protein